MKWHKCKNWIFSFFAIVTVTASAAYLFSSDNYANQLVKVQFSDLTDADVDLILAVKAEMHAAKIQSN